VVVISISVTLRTPVTFAVERDVSPAQSVSIRNILILQECSVGAARLECLSRMLPPANVRDATVVAISISTQMRMYLRATFARERPVSPVQVVGIKRIPILRVRCVGTVQLECLQKTPLRPVAPAVPMANTKAKWSMTNTVAMTVRLGCLQGTPLRPVAPIATMANIKATWSTVNTIARVVRLGCLQRMPPSALVAPSVVISILTQMRIWKYVIFATTFVSPVKMASTKGIPISQEQCVRAARLECLQRMPKLAIAVSVPVEKFKRSSKTWNICVKIVHKGKRRWATSVLLVMSLSVSLVI